MHIFLYWDWKEVRDCRDLHLTQKYTGEGTKSFPGKTNSPLTIAPGRETDLCAGELCSGIVFKSTQMSIQASTAMYKHTCSGSRRKGRVAEEPGRAVRAGGQVSRSQRKQSPQDAGATLTQPAT